MDAASEFVKGAKVRIPGSRRMWEVITPGPLVRVAPCVKHAYTAEFRNVPRRSLRPWSAS